MLVDLIVLNKWTVVCLCYANMSRQVSLVHLNAMIKKSNSNSKGLKVSSLLRSLLVVSGELSGVFFLIFCRCFPRGYFFFF